MSDTWLGGTAVFWTGLQTIGVLLSAVFVVLTVIALYRQVRVAVRASQFDGIRYVQELVDKFGDQRTELFKTFPIELVTEARHFPRRPPGGQVGSGPSKGERRSMAATETQRAALTGMTEEQWAVARTVINKLNDIWQLAEDGYVDRGVLLGKYHTMMIRLCHFVELPRRVMEAKEHGGNYGQRLLRMRHTAVVYNTICPKHREVPIMISGYASDGTRATKVIVDKITSASAVQRLVWDLRRWLSLY